MALSFVQKEKLIGRLLLKVQNGQLDPKTLIDAIVNAYDGNNTPLQQLAAAELQAWKLELQAAKAASDAQSTAMTAELAGLG